MSDLVQIVNGCPPWSPAPETEIVEVVHRYNIPLLAVVKQAGTQFMARCLIGELGPNSLWIYNRLDEIESVILREGSPEEIDRQVDDLCHGPLAVAVSVNDKVAFATHLTVPDEPDLLDRVHWIATKLAEAANTAQRGAEEIAQEFAHVR